MRLFRTVVAGVLVLGFAAALRADDKAARGKQLFEEQKCKLCHRIDGEGNPKGVLDEVGSKHDADTLRMWLTKPKEMAEKAGSTRKPPMRSFEKLPKEDLDALIAYLSTLKKKS